MRICDSVLSSILSSSKTGSSVIKCLTRIGEEAKHTIQLLTPYTSNKKVSDHFRFEIIPFRDLYNMTSF